MKDCPNMYIKKRNGDVVKHSCVKDYCGSCPYDEVGKCMGVENGKEDVGSSETITPTKREGTDDSGRKESFTQ